MKISVDKEGNPWGVDVNGTIFKYAKGKWEKLPGVASDIGCGPEGSVFIVSKVKKDDKGNAVLKLNFEKRTWVDIGGSAKGIAVGQGGRPYIYNKHNELFWPDEACPG